MRSKWVKKSWSLVPLLAPCLHRRHRPLLFPGGRPQRTDAMVPLACAISSRRASRQSSSWSPPVDPAISNWAPLSVHRCRIRPSDCRIYHITQPLSTPPPHPPVMKPRGDSRGRTGFCSITVSLASSSAGGDRIRAVCRRIRLPRSWLVLDHRQ
jgi:hypothetical protein